MPNKELGQVDAYALAHDLNRSQAMLEILRRGLEPDAAPSAADAKLDAIAAKLDAVAAAQGELKVQQLAQSTVIADAIKNQPIAVQQQALPAPEVTDADVQAYIRERRPDIALDMWGDPVAAKKKGFLAKRHKKHGCKNAQKGSAKKSCKCKKH